MPRLGQASGMPSLWFISLCNIVNSSYDSSSNAQRTTSHVSQYGKAALTMMLMKAICFGHNGLGILYLKGCGWLEPRRPWSCKVCMPGCVFCTSGESCMWLTMAWHSEVVNQYRTAILTLFPMNALQCVTDYFPAFWWPNGKQIKQMLPAVVCWARLDEDPFAAIEILKECNPEKIYKWVLSHQLIGHQLTLLAGQNKNSVSFLMIWKNKTTCLISHVLLQITSLWKI